MGRRWTAPICAPALGSHRGVVRRADQTLIASTVELTARRASPPSPAPRPVRLRGTVDAVACSARLVQVEQDGAVEATQRTIRLTDATEFHCADGVLGACDCSAIAVGVPLGVSGTVLPQAAGASSTRPPSSSGPAPSLSTSRR
jgi:hypothetical protein